MVHQLAAIGHILYDIRCYLQEFPKPDRTSFTNGRIKYSAGGSACNVAVAASRLGINSAMCGAIGFDDYGKYLIDNFISEGVDPTYVKIAYGESTGVSIIAINAEGEVEIIEMLGANSALDKNDIKNELIEGASMLHMTGTEVGVLEKAAGFAAQKGVKVSFDPGRAISSRGYSRLMNILRNTDYVIVNKKEAVQLAETSNDKEASEIVDILEREVKKEITYVIKSGKDPVYVRSPSEAFLIHPFNVQVVDTLGAGDTFAGGFVAGIINGMNVRNSAIQATAVAALKIQKEGAQSSPTLQEYTDFIRKNRKDIVVENL